MFGKIEVDPRLDQALVQMGFTEPTQIQATAIPIALDEGKDIVAMARTGSGKTVAYLLPILQSLLTRKASGSDSYIFGLVLVPSRELADQIMRVLAQLTKFSSKELRFVNIAQQMSEEVRSTLLSEPHEIVVATPASALEQFNRKRLDPLQLGYIVLDEADLLASFGYDEELKELHHLCGSASKPQAWLMSATLGEDIKPLKEAWCDHPVTLQLEEPEASDQLQQFYVSCSEIDKFLLLYVIFKLGLIRGKTLLFTNDIERAYRLKLFLEQFGIKSAVLNRELPQESRTHIVRQFDKHWFNLLIATDDAPPKTKNGRNNSSTEYGVSRGVDFKGVACVINFDLPVSSKAYVHRVGRTARANQKGMALSFVVPKEEFGKHKVASSSTNKNDEKVLARIMRANDVKPYQFDMSQVNSFRYRMEDAFRSITRANVREARVKELKAELLASDKLQRHFEENPDDLAALRHDDEHNQARNNKELKNVPSYLLPASARAPTPLFAEPTKKWKRKDNKRVTKKSKKKRDPLKSFSR